MMEFMQYINNIAFYVLINIWRIYSAIDIYCIQVCYIFIFIETNKYRVNKNNIYKRCCKLSFSIVNCCKILAVCLFHSNTELKCTIFSFNMETFFK